MKLPLSISIFCALAALSTAAFSANSSFVQVPLTNTGVDADARGAVLASLTAQSSELIVQVAKLNPSAAFQIEVGGIIEGAFVTNSNGNASVKFRAPNAGGGRALDFDPRGKQLRILSGGQSVLQATLSGSGEPSGSVVVERVNLRLGNVAGAAGKATADFRLRPDGRRIFKVEVEGAGAGPFELFVGGIKRGNFTTVGVQSKIRFADSTDDSGFLPLDFDPRGQVVDVVRNGRALFSAEFAARALGVNVASPRLSSVAIRSTGVDPDGSAEAKLRVDARARKHFSVEIEDVPVGTYDLLVNGVDVADIVVTTVTGGTKGEVEFTSGDDDPGELPLTFDPVGKVLTVRQGGTTFFQSPFTIAAGDGSVTPAPEPPSELNERLGSTGLDSDAKATARYRVDDRGRHKFNVEIEDVPLGDYSLVVAGTVRGTIRVIATANGPEGEIEFDSKVEAGHLPLNFNPRGQLIEIVSNAGRYFSHLLGGGSAVGGGGTTVPFDINVPLLSTGADANATAKANLKRNEAGNLSFEVEVEDVNAGAYELLVGGVVRGTLNVVADGTGTRGQIEFESEAGSVPLLNFPVIGQSVVIRQGATVFFQRAFPPQ